MTPEQVLERCRALVVLAPGGRILVLMACWAIERNSLQFARKLIRRWRDGVCPLLIGIREDSSRVNGGHAI